MTIRSYLLVAVAALTLAFFVGRGIAQASIGIRASVATNEVTAETAGVVTTSTTTTQNYSLNFQKSLTNTISLNGDLRWINTLIDKDGVETETKSAYPVFSLSYRPPAQYNIRLGYNRTESSPSQGDRISTSNLNAGFDLPAGKLPSLNLSYNKSLTEDHAKVQQINNESTVLRASSSYGFKYREADLSVNYNYGLSTTEDIVGETTTTTPSHLISTGASRDFFGGKLKASLNYGIDMRETTTESLGTESRFEQTVGASVGLEAESVATPTLIAMTNEPELIDNNRSTSVNPSSATTTIDLAQVDWNIGIGFSTPKAIHELHLYVSSVLPAVTLEAYETGGSWTVYTSSDAINWSPIGSTIEYESVFSRYSFIFSETTARYFKVVNANAASGIITVTEMMARGYALTTPKKSFTSKTTRSFSGLTMAYTPTDRLNLGMNLTVDNTSTERDGIADIDTKNSRYGLNGRYIVIPEYLQFASTYASTISAPSDGDENETNSYTATLSATPLETVSGSLSYLLSENLLAGTMQSEQSSINASVFMAIYTGIDLNLAATRSTTESPQANSESDGSSYQWGLRLKPWRQINVLINGSSSSSSSTQDGVSISSTSQTLDMNISYTPSRKIYMSADFDFEPSSSAVYSLTWTPSRAIQCRIRYNSNETSSGFSSDLSWRPFRPISVHTGYAVIWTDNATDDQTETIYTRASIRF